MGSSRGNSRPAGMDVVQCLMLTTWCTASSSPACGWPVTRDARLVKAMRKLRGLDRTWGMPEKFRFNLFRSKVIRKHRLGGWWRCMIARYSSHRADTRPVICSKMLRVTVNRFLTDMDNQGSTLELYKADRTSAVREICSLVSRNSRKIRVIFW